MKGLDEATYRGLAYSKYLFSHGVEHLQDKTALGTNLSILHFHNAIEMLMLNLYLHFGGDSKERTFMRLYEKLNEKLEEINKKLTMKEQIYRLNNVRVLIQHSGMPQAYDTGVELKGYTEQFLVQTLKDTIGLELSEISLVSLIDNKRVKEYLKEAEKAMRQEQKEYIFINCGKAFAVLLRSEEKEPWLDPVEVSPDKILFEFTGEEFYNHYGSKLEKAIEVISEPLNILMLGIDFQKYKKFKCLTPIVHILASGEPAVYWTGDYLNEANLTKENAQFCLDFVIETALKVQSQSFGLKSNLELKSTKNKE